MKISCTQENLNRGLFVVSHVASKNVTLPILNNVLFQVKQDEIKLSATNLEIGIHCIVRGKVEEEGDFTVQSRLLTDYINLLPKQQVDLVAPNGESNQKDESLQIVSKNHKTKIKGQQATDFPVIPLVEQEKENTYSVDPNQLRNALSQVVFAASTSETRPEINGVAFAFAKGKLTIAATDSYRLAEKTIELGKSGQAQERKVIVPARTLQELLRILGGAKDPAEISEVKEINIYLTDNQIAFAFSGIELVSRLVEGKYPDYQQIIPQQTSTKIIISTSELNAAVKSASLFARSGIYDIMLKTDPATNELVVSSTSSQLGENTSRISATIEGGGGESSIVLNYRYVLDGLQNINSDQVELGITDGDSPSVIRPVGKDQDYLYLIMPIKQ